MFDYLRERMSLVFSRYWPMAEGRITALYVDPYSNRYFTVAYEFSNGSDGPFTGEASPPFWYDGVGILNPDSFVGRLVFVRYRRDDPSVNTLDKTFWQGLEGL